MTHNDDPTANANLTSAPDPAQVAADDALLAQFFSAGREQPCDPDPALLARILDAGMVEQAAMAAERVLAVRPGGATASRFAPRGLASWFGTLGGWGAVTGLATATVAGIWLGFSPPTGLAGLADGVFGTSLSGSGNTVDQVDLLPTFESYLTEG